MLSNLPIIPPAAEGQGSKVNSIVFFVLITQASSPMCTQVLLKEQHEHRATGS